jgi:hypothetical protein
MVSKAWEILMLQFITVSFKYCEAGLNKLRARLQPVGRLLGTWNIFSFLPFLPAFLPFPSYNIFRTGS